MGLKKVGSVFLIGSLVTTFSLFSFADGTETGGGGDVAILSKGGVVLADPFLDLYQVQPDNPGVLRRSLAPEIRSMILAYSKLFEDDLIELASGKAGLRFESSYQDLKKSNAHKSLILESFNKLIDLESDWQLFVVQSEAEMLKYCDPKGSKSYQVNPGVSRIQKVACTIDQKTYVIEPLFKKMNLENQSLLMVHEIMTTILDAHGSRSYGMVASLTSGLKTSVAIYRKQKHGDFSPLTDTELSSLAGFYRSIQNLEFLNKKLGNPLPIFAINRYGGLIYDGANADESAIVSFGNFVAPSFNLGFQSQILGYDTIKIVGGSLEMGKNSSLINSKVASAGSVTIEEGAKLQNVSVSAAGQFFAGRKVVIEESQISSSRNIRIEDTALVKRSKIFSGADVYLGHGTLVTDTTVDVKSLSIGSESILQQVRTDDQFYVVLGRKVFFNACIIYDAKVPGQKAFVIFVKDNQQCQFGTINSLSQEAFLPLDQKSQNLAVQGSLDGVYHVSYLPSNILSTEVEGRITLSSSDRMQIDSIVINSKDIYSGTGTELITAKIEHLKDSSGAISYRLSNVKYTINLYPGKMPIGFMSLSKSGELNRAELRTQARFANIYTEMADDYRSLLFESIAEDVNKQLPKKTTYRHGHLLIRY